MVADAGTVVARARSGATGLMRIAGRTSLARAPGGISLVRAPGGISLVRIALKATLGSLRCRHHQEGTMNTTKTRGLGASKSRVLSLASWAELKPQPHSVSSSSLLAR